MHDRLGERVDATERLRGVVKLRGRGLELATREQELDVAGVLVRRAVEVPTARERRGEATVHGVIHRIDRDGGPKHGERGDAVPVLREEGGALLQLLEIRAPVIRLLLRRGRDHTIQRSHAFKSGACVHSQTGLPRMGEAA